MDISTPHRLSATELSEAIEATCAKAAKAYADGQDTTALDATVDMLFAEQESRS